MSLSAFVKQLHPHTQVGPHALRGRPRGPSERRAWAALPSPIPGGRVSGAAAERDATCAAFFAGEPPSWTTARPPPPHSSPSLRATPRPRLSITSLSGLFHYFNGGGEEAATPGRRERGTSEAARGVPRRGGGVPYSDAAPLGLRGRWGSRAPPARFPPHAVLAVHPGGTGRRRGGR